jgi:hypothetical protein
MPGQEQRTCCGIEEVSGQKQETYEGVGREERHAQG